MGLLSVCCCSGSKSQPYPEGDELLWAPLPADQPKGRRWGGRSASPAPAFGEGALREERWAPQFVSTFKQSSGS